MWLITQLQDGVNAKYSPCTTRQIYLSGLDMVLLKLVKYKFSI